LGFCQDGKVLTLCNPDVSVLGLSGGTPLVFDRRGLFNESRDACVPVGANARLVRQPAYAESVFVVGKDSSGLYCAMTGSKVMHVGLGANTFTISDTDSGSLPLKGGLVLSRLDGAVVGVFDTMMVDRKSRRVGLCKGYPKREGSPFVGTSALEALAAKCPFLTVGSWPEGSLDRAVTHASVTVEGASAQTEMAMVGDTAMRTAALVRLSVSGKPSSEWQAVIQEDQCNAKLAARCEELGLHSLLVKSDYLNVATGGKVYADLLEALVGVVYLNEKVENFEMFCEWVGVLRKTY